MQKHFGVFEMTPDRCGASPLNKPQDIIFWVEDSFLLVFSLPYCCSLFCCC